MGTQSDTDVGPDNTTLGFGGKNKKTETKRRHEMGNIVGTP